MKKLEYLTLEEVHDLVTHSEHRFDSHFLVTDDNGEQQRLKSTEILKSFEWRANGYRSPFVRIQPDITTD